MGVAARLTAYASTLLLVFGMAWFVGGLVRPSAEQAPEAPTSGDGHDTGSPAGLGGPEGEPATNGLASAAAGYRLALADATFVQRAPGELRFVVFGPEGLTVTAFASTPRDPSPLHAVVVRRDAAGFQRL